MNAPTLTTPAHGLVDTLRRRRANGWLSALDEPTDEIELGGDADARLLIEPDCVELAEARQAQRHAEERLALHEDGRAPAFVWERRPYFLTSGLGTLLAGLGFATSPFAETSAATALMSAAVAGALALVADRLGRDFRLAWRAGQTDSSERWLRVAGTGMITAGLGAGGAMMLAGHAAVWTLLLLATLLTLTIAGWRRQDPDPERERLADAALESQAKVEALEAERRQELEQARSKVDQLLADLAVA